MEQRLKKITWKSVLQTLVQDKIITVENHTDVINYMRSMFSA